MADLSCMETFYNETSVYHDRLSESAIVSLVYLVNHIGKKSANIINKKHLKIYL